MNQSVLVTGATGFIGGKLTARLLAEQWSVHVLVRPESDASALPDHPNLRIHRSANSVEALTDVMMDCMPDLVFHLASLYLNDHRPDQVDLLVQSNVLFPAQLMEAMTAAGVRKLVNTGTAWQHYESSGYAPVNLYAATKQAGQDIADFYASAHGLSIITLKLFDTYGPGDTRRKLIKILCDAAVDAETLDMSPGEQTVDLTHVDDVIDAFMIAGRLAKEGGPGLNQGFFVSGERLTVKSLVDAVAGALGRPVNARFGGRPYRPREVMTPYAPTESEILPGWHRTRSIAGSVRAMSPAIER